jgi:hypothetical protein
MAKSERFLKSSSLNIILHEEVSLAHLAREVDVQTSHLGSSLNRREFGFLFSKNQNRCRGFLYRISFQKKHNLARAKHISE